MRPRIKFLSQETIERIVAEAYDLLSDPGVRVHSDRAMRLLAEHGAAVDFEAQVAQIPADLARQAVETAPSSFYLYDADGQPAVHYGNDDVQFDPGSAAIEIIDHGSKHSREPVTADFVRFIKLADGLGALDAVATSLVCADVPQEASDLYHSTWFSSILTSRSSPARSPSRPGG